MLLLGVVAGFVAFVAVGLWFGLPVLLRGSDTNLPDPKQLRQDKAPAAQPLETLGQQSKETKVDRPRFPGTLARHVISRDTTLTSPRLGASALSTTAQSPRSRGEQADFELASNTAGRPRNSSVRSPSPRRSPARKQSAGPNRPVAPPTPARGSLGSESI